MHSISPREQVLMQAALQPFVDGSISKTVSLRGKNTADAVDEIFRTAYELGLKGCTVFPQNARPGVLAQRAGGRLVQPALHCCDAEREMD